MVGDAAYVGERLRDVDARISWTSRLKVMTGLAYPIRLAGYGLRAPKTRVRGRELAGRVTSTASSR